MKMTLRTSSTVLHLADRVLERTKLVEWGGNQIIAPGMLYYKMQDRLP